MKKNLPDDFPKTPADWARVIAAAPGEDRPLTAEDLELMERSVVVHSGGFVAVREALAKRRRELNGKRSPKQQVEEMNDLAIALT